MWQEASDSGDVVLFRWRQLLVDDTLSCLGLTTAANSPITLKVGTAGQSSRTVDERTMQDVCSATALRRALADYDEEQEEVEFQAGFYDCGVCFTSHPGSECLRFSPCQDVFCRECLRSYFEVQISDGEVRSLRCPTIKCESQALPTQVKSLVSPELFAQYDRLLLQRGLDEMADVVYCPVLSCQCPVLKEQDSTMAACGQCSFVFCMQCRRAWHGVAPCRVTRKDREALRKAYESGTPEERAALEARYGTAAMKRIIEEAVSEQWLLENAKECPSCSAQIQRTEGCNKMTCRQCHADFCWLCLLLLPRGNPYRHFGNTSSPCYNRLFQGTTMMDMEDFWD